MKTPFPRSYWVIPGLLLAGEFPGSVNRDEARSKIRSLIDYGVRQIINLMDPGEKDHSGNPFNDYEPIVSEIAGQRSAFVNFLRFPITDLNVPAMTTMEEILCAVMDAVDHRKPVYIHCWGGVGRTGTVVGCFLMKNGLANRGNVLKVIADLRQNHPKIFRTSPETEAQRKFVRQDIEAFIEHEQDRGLKPNTVRTHMCIIYAFLRFLINKKVLSYELLERKIRLRLSDSLPRAIEPEHIKRLLSVIDRVRDRAMILILLRTGMRSGELLNTTIDDIDLKNQRILIYEADKTGLGRVVYFSTDALQALISWLQIRDQHKQRIFYGQGRSSLSYESARSVFCKYLQKAGLQYHGYTLHCLRHTFATDLLNARMPQECLRVLLGHTNLNVTSNDTGMTENVRIQRRSLGWVLVAGSVFRRDTGTKVENRPGA